MAVGLACGMKNDYLIGGSYNPAFTDNTPIWNAIVSEMQEGDTLLLPPRYCAFRSSPMPVPNGIHVDSMGAKSCLIRCYQPGWDTEIFITVAQQDSITDSVELFAGDETFGGVAIGRSASCPEDCPQRVVLRNIVTSHFGNGRWYGGCMIDGINGAPHYGSRVHTLSDCTFHSVGVADKGGFGLMLKGVNAVGVTNLLIASFDPMVWGLWIIGTKDQPSNSVCVSGPCNSSVLMYGTRSSAVYASALGKIIMDNDCASNACNAAFVDVEPVLGGIDNHVYANGRHWNSIQ
jgi:hypothetical protein